MREKRRHSRVSVELSVRLEMADGTSRVGTATDVSLGGMFVETSEPPAFGAKTTIVCHLDKVAEAARLDAVVRWAKPGGVGLQFGLLGARDTHALAALLKSSKEGEA